MSKYLPKWWEDMGFSRVEPEMPGPRHVIISDGEVLSRCVGKKIADAGIHEVECGMASKVDALGIRFDDNTKLWLYHTRFNCNHTSIDWPGGPFRTPEALAGNVFEGVTLGSLMSRETTEEHGELTRARTDAARAFCSIDDGKEEIALPVFVACQGGIWATTLFCCWHFPVATQIEVAMTLNPHSAMLTKDDTQAWVRAVNERERREREERIEEIEEAEEVVW